VGTLIIAAKGRAQEDELERTSGEVISKGKDLTASNWKGRSSRRRGKAHERGGNRPFLDQRGGSKKKTKKILEGKALGNGSGRTARRVNT